MNSLLLAGGGARAAYQVGVLKAITDYHFKSMHRKEPLFNIFTGVSAGAINSTALACLNDNPQEAINFIYKFWTEIQVNQIYEVDNFSLIKTALPWLKTLFPFLRKNNLEPTFLLNNSPLAELLKAMPFDRLQSLIEQNIVHSTSITCSSYHSGQSICFFQGNQNIKEWDKPRRQGLRDILGTHHLLASSSLPIIFPAQQIRGEWFGDGSMREQAPLSPSIHMGAKRIFVVGTGKKNIENKSLLSQDISIPQINRSYPSLAQIGGHILNGLFLDNIQADVERLKRTNQIISKIVDNQDLTMRKIDLFMCDPSVRIDDIASQHVNRLPKSILKLLERIGVTEKFGGTLASYLLFEKHYCSDLIRLGYEDGWNQREEIHNFLFHHSYNSF